jgi:hypothetical protein
LLRHNKIGFVLHLLSFCSGARTRFGGSDGFGELGRRAFAGLVLVTPLHRAEQAIEFRGPQYRGSGVDITEPIVPATRSGSGLQLIGGGANATCTLGLSFWSSRTYGPPSFLVVGLGKLLLKHNKIGFVLHFLSFCLGARTRFGGSDGCANSGGRVRV